MNIKEQINADLKSAMLAGEKDRVTTLRGLKSTILYAEVANDARDSGLPEPEVIQLLQKEAKKRQESADLFRQGGNLEKSRHEEEEKEIIERYLPEQMLEEDVAALVQAEIDKIGSVNTQQMGQIIGAVKKASNGRADGALIARLVKDALGA
jgi:uncharacterized protein